MKQANKAISPGEAMEEAAKESAENMSVEITTTDSTEKPPRPGSAGKRKRVESLSDQVCKGTLMTFLNQ